MTHGPIFSRCTPYDTTKRMVEVRYGIEAHFIADSLYAFGGLY